MRHIKNFISNCDVCPILKGHTKPIRLKLAPVSTRPFEAVSIDILGPLPTTQTENKYILCIICLYSRFVILKPLREKTSMSIIYALNSAFNYFGFPSTLLSDNALEFVSSAMHQFASINSIKKTTVLPYSPHSNGCVERNNRKILQLLRLYVNAVEASEWDEYLDTTANIINNSLNVSINDTPAFVALGYDSSPYIVRENIKTLYCYDSDEAHVMLREKRSSNIRDHIRNNILNAREIQHRYKNKYRKDKSFEIGNRVIFKNHCKKNKLQLNFIGPAVITGIKKHGLTLKINDKTFDRINSNHCILLKNKVDVNTT